jgi:hypothetical protein
VTCANPNEIRQIVTEHLNSTYAINHTTLQVECAGETGRLCGCEAIQPALEK